MNVNKIVKRVMTATMAMLLVLGAAQGSAFASQPPQMQMILEYESLYDFEETTQRFRENVADAGWSVVQVFDYQEILGEKGYDIDNIHIYAVCSGKYSAAILSLSEERMVSPLMPCTVSIYEKSDGKTYIAQLNSGEVAQPFGGVIAETMQAVAHETNEMIQDLVVSSPVAPAQALSPLSERYQGHMAWFARQTGEDGLTAYATAIQQKEAANQPLDDPEAAEAFKIDYPHLFKDDSGAAMQMILEHASKYDFETTISLLKESVAAAGWSVVGEFDYQEILGEKGFEIDNIKILAVCSGKYSAEILQLDDERMVSPLMPCRLAVYEKADGNTYIARLNSGEVAQPFGGVIAEVMQAVAQDTEAIVKDLIQ
jgi:uncharacterized protein (DUF302 family)